MLVKCAGNCGRMVKEDNAVCSQKACIERVFMAPPKPEASTYKAFSHLKGQLVTALAVAKEVK